MCSTIWHRGTLRQLTKIEKVPILPWGARKNALSTIRCSFDVISKTLFRKSYRSIRIILYLFDVTSQHPVIFDLLSFRFFRVIFSARIVCAVTSVKQSLVLERCSCLAWLMVVTALFLSVSWRNIFSLLYEPFYDLISIKLLLSLYAINKKGQRSSVRLWQFLI